MFKASWDDDEARNSLIVLGWITCERVSPDEQTETTRRRRGGSRFQRDYYYYSEQVWLLDGHAFLLPSGSTRFRPTDKTCLHAQRCWLLTDCGSTKYKVPEWHINYYCGDWWWPRVNAFWGYRCMTTRRHFVLIPMVHFMVQTTAGNVIDNVVELPIYRQTECGGGGRTWIDQALFDWSPKKGN